MPKFRKGRIAALSCVMLVSVANKGLAASCSASGGAPAPVTPTAPAATGPMQAPPSFVPPPVTSTPNVTPNAATDAMRNIAPPLPGGGLTGLVPSSPSAIGGDIGGVEITGSDGLSSVASDPRASFNKINAEYEKNYNERNELKTQREQVQKEIDDLRSKHDQDILNAVVQTFGGAPLQIGGDATTGRGR